MGEKIAWKSLFGILVVYVTISAWWLFPIVKDPFHVVPDTGDTFHNIWIMGENSKKILNLNFDFSEGNIYFPSEDVMDYSERLFIQTLLFLPFYIIKQPIFGYNVQLIFSFIATSFLAFLIFYRVGGSKKLSFLGSLIVGFFPMKFLHLPHLQLLSFQWVLLPVYYLTLIEGRPKNIKQVIVLYIASIFQLVSWGYLTIFLYLMICLYGLYGILTEKRKRMGVVVNYFIYFFVVIVSCVYFYVPYINLFKNGVVRTSNEASSYGVDLLQFAVPSPKSVWYESGFARFKGLNSGIDISGLFSGFSLVFVLVFSFIKIEIDRAKMRVCFEVRYVQKWVVFFFVLTMFFLFSSFGNMVKVGGFELVANPIYQISNWLIYGKSIRYIAAYGIPIYFGIGALISLSQSRLVKKLWLVLSIVFLFENLPRIGFHDYKLDSRIYEAYQFLDSEKNIGSLLEYPINRKISGDDVYWWDQFEYMYTSIYHQKKLVNGISGFFPPKFVETVDKMKNFPDEESVTWLRELGVSRVLVHMERLKDDDLLRVENWNMTPCMVFADKYRLYCFD